MTPPSKDTVPSATGIWVPEVAQRPSVFNWPFASINGNHVIGFGLFEHHTQAPCSGSKRPGIAARQLPIPAECVPMPSDSLSGSRQLSIAHHRKAEFIEESNDGTPAGCIGARAWQLQAAQQLGIRSLGFDCTSPMQTRGKRMLGRHNSAADVLVWLVVSDDSKPQCRTHTTASLPLRQAVNTTTRSRLETVRSRSTVASQGSERPVPGPVQLSGSFVLCTWTLCMPATSPIQAITKTEECQDNTIIASGLL